MRPAPTHRHRLAMAGLLALQAGAAAAVVQLRASGTLDADDCPYPGSGGGNGDAEPGESMRMSVTVVNSPATEDATAVVVTTTTTTPGVTIVPGTETVNIGTVPRNDRTTGTTTVAFGLDPDFACPGTATFTFSVACAQGDCPFENPSDVVVPVACVRCAGACCAGDGWCDHTRDEAGCTAQGGTYQGDLTDCAATSCPGGSCDVAQVQAIADLVCVRSGNDVRLSWSRDPQAGDGYNAWYVAAKSDLPACDPATCPGSLGVAGCQPTGSAGSVTCSHGGAVPGAAGNQNLYGVRGVCDGIEAGR